MAESELLADATAAKIARMIESGEYAAGQRLPPERDLAEHLGISRTAIREAFRALQAMGLVEAHVGRGRFVCEEGAERRSHYLATQLFELHSSDLSELSAVREVLEMAATRAIPRQACATVARGMRQVLDQARAALEQDDLRRVAQLDSELHVIPIDHCVNRPLRILANGVILSMGQPVRAVLSDRERVNASFREHERIVRAFQDGDIELAAVLIGHHQTEASRHRTHVAAAAAVGDGRRAQP